MGKDHWDSLDSKQQEELVKIYHAKCGMHVGVNLSKYFSKGFATYWPHSGKPGPKRLPASAEANLRKSAEAGKDVAIKFLPQ